MSKMQIPSPMYSYAVIDNRGGCAFGHLQDKIGLCDFHGGPASGLRNFELAEQ
jgi:hypothetical protein